MSLVYADHPLAAVVSSQLSPLVHVERSVRKPPFWHGPVEVVTFLPKDPNNPLGRIASFFCSKTSTPFLNEPDVFVAKQSVDEGYPFVQSFFSGWSTLPYQQILTVPQAPLKGKVAAALHLLAKQPDNNILDLIYPVLESSQGLLLEEDLDLLLKQVPQEKILCWLSKTPSEHQTLFIFRLASRLAQLEPPMYPSAECLSALGCHFVTAELTQIPQNLIDHLLHSSDISSLPIGFVMAFRLVLETNTEIDQRSALFLSEHSKQHTALASAFLVALKSTDPISIGRQVWLMTLESYWESFQNTVELKLRKELATLIEQTPSNKGDKLHHFKKKVLDLTYDLIPKVTTTIDEWDKEI